MSLIAFIIAGMLTTAVNKSPVCDTTIKPEPSDDISIVQPIEPLESDTLMNPNKIQIEEQERDGAIIKTHFYVGKHNRKIEHGTYEVYTKRVSPGKLIEFGIYRHGKREGKWTRWNPNGKVISETDYKNNKFNGYIILYRENGVVAEKTKMVEGKLDCKDGVSEGFYENGKMKFEYRVKDGFEIKNIKYDTLGKPIGKAE